MVCKSIYQNNFRVSTPLFEEERECRPKTPFSVVGGVSQHEESQPLSPPPPPSPFFIRHQNMTMAGIVIFSLLVAVMAGAFLGANSVDHSNMHDGVVTRINNKQIGDASPHSSVASIETSTGLLGDAVAYEPRTLLATTPTFKPTRKPQTRKPTKLPISKVPTRIPTSKPTGNPTNSPTTLQTSSAPTPISKVPTRIPTSKPTGNPTNSPTTLQTSSAPTPIPFVRGDLAITVASLGIKICTGMSVRVIARAGQKVSLASGGTSSIDFPAQPDGAGIVPLSTGGYVYVGNSELSSSAGGVYGLYFDSSGNVSNFAKLLGGTTRNCGGGLTPWNTWISCEEFGTGQCWQIDPNPSQLRAQVTPLGGTGGNFESVAVDNRNPLQPIFYVTEDAQYGALRKYTPVASLTTANFDTVHTTGGFYEYLVIVNSTHFKWSTDLQEGRNSQATYFSYCEGIDFHNGYLYFVSKTLYKMFVLNLDNGTYTSSSTKYGSLGTGGGVFNDQPDQIIRNGGDYLYLTEDGGSTPGVYSINKLTGAKYAIFQGYSSSLVNDETTGLAFSPDGTKMYAAFQDCGCLLEFRRDDGISFDGEKLDLKFHAPSDIFE